jgi:glycerate kinase
MRILIAPQEFKGSLTAAQAAEAIAAGARRAGAAVELDVLPLADGGPGTLDALVAALHGDIRGATVTGPLGESVVARYGVIDHRAVIETAEANGLVLMKGRRLEPERATTYGVGRLIRAALDGGCRHFLVGVGGSATNDGGAGMAQALGFRLLDDAGRDLDPGVEPLAGLDRIDATGADPRLRESAFEVAVDVQNPLYGPEGATAVYGLQKGVRPDQIERFDAALHRLGAVINRDLGVSVLKLPAGGAAGGLGAGLAGFLHARLRPGFSIVADAVNLTSHIRAAQLVLTGEGRLDSQTPFGKTIAGVAGAAKHDSVPVIALVGSIAPGFSVSAVKGLTAAFAITARPLSLEEAQSEAAPLLEDLAEQCVRLSGCLMAAGETPLRA